MAHLAKGRRRRPSSFFFQAEDGIRDRTVTGVQTCALPISSSAERLRTGSSRPPPGWRWRTRCPSRSPWRRRRSEERRVGKEGGAGGGPSPEEVEGAVGLADVGCVIRVLPGWSETVIDTRVL